jgi:putative SOS response-associated peptidase YedK
VAPARARWLMGELEGPDSGMWVRSFTIITSDAKELVSQQHDGHARRVGPEDRKRWRKAEPAGVAQTLRDRGHDDVAGVAAAQLTQERQPGPTGEEVAEPANGRPVERANEGAPDCEPTNSE